MKKVAITFACCIAAFGTCSEETKCAAAVQRSESQLDSLEGPRTPFLSARRYELQANLIMALADWDAFRALEIDSFQKEIDGALRAKGLGDGSLSMLLASRERYRLILTTATADRSAVGGKQSQALLAGVEELNAAKSEVDEAIREVEERAKAAKRETDGAEKIHTELEIRKLGHVRRRDVLTSLAEIYRNRHIRLQLAAERCATLSDWEGAAEMHMPVGGLPEIEGIRNLDPRDTKRVMKNAEKILGLKR
jgi:hypothetical protein